MSAPAVIKAEAAPSMRSIRPFAGKPIAVVPEVSPPQPSATELEVMRLQAQLNQMQATLHELDEQVRDAFKVRLAEATQRIAQEHRDDDQRRVGVLERAAQEASANLAKQLSGSVQPAAIAIARHALARFCALRADDAAWLAEVVAEQVSKVGTAMIVAVKMNPADFAKPLIRGELEARLAGKCALAGDATVAEGSVRLDLRLGQVEIDPRAGLQAIMAAMVDTLGDSHA